MTKEIDLTGKRFGQITVIRKDTSNHGDTRVRWICHCTCGKEWSVRGTNLRAGNTKSCGCVSRSQHLKHGLHRSPEYQAWKGVIQRCTNPSYKGFAYYGGRGITVCDEWKSFESFYRDMGSRPTDKHTLDRIDNDKGYEPSNCRWVPMLVQSRNTRRNVIVDYQGRRMVLSEAIGLSGLKASTVQGRRRLGWPEKSLFLPHGSKRSSTLSTNT